MQIPPRTGTGRDAIERRSLFKTNWASTHPNHVMFGGRVVATPRLRETRGGHPRTLLLLRHRGYSVNSTGSTSRSVTARIKLYGRLALGACEWLSWGDEVIVEGKLIPWVETVMDYHLDDAQSQRGRATHLCILGDRVSILYCFAEQKRRDYMLLFGETEDARELRKRLGFAPRDDIAKVSLSRLAEVRKELSLLSEVNAEEAPQ